MIKKKLYIYTPISGVSIDSEGSKLCHYIASGPLHTHTHCFLTSILILSSHHCLGLLNELFCILDCPLNCETVLSGRIYRSRHVYIEDRGIYFSEIMVPTYQAIRCHNPGDYNMNFIAVKTSDDIF